MLKVVFLVTGIVFFAFLFKKIIDSQGKKFPEKEWAWLLVKIPNAWRDESARPGL